MRDTEAPGSVLRQAVYALVPLAILLVVVETTLRLLGLGAPDARMPPGRGCDPRAPYVVPFAALVTDLAWRQSQLPDSPYGYRMR